MDKLLAAVPLNSAFGTWMPGDEVRVESEELPSISQATADAWLDAGVLAVAPPDLPAPAPETATAPAPERATRPQPRRQGPPKRVSGD